MTQERNILFPREVTLREMGKSKIIEGWAILFGTISAPIRDGLRTYREIMEPGSVTKDLLDSFDFRLTMFHNREIILARSNKGRGTLQYQVTPQGVRFWAEMPDTEDGRRALELVARGDISGCSFCYTTDETDASHVTHERKTDPKTGEEYILRRVKRVTGIYDFTLAASPAYPQTTVSRRELERLARLHQDERKSAEVNRLRELGGVRPNTPKTKLEEVNRLRTAAELDPVTSLTK